MSKLKRSIFFWTLVLLFLITAPLVVLRARGYRFDLSRGVFVYSGTIVIKSNPQNINVTLNGELNESKKLDRINSSYNISGLIPADYDISVNLPDFQTWRKKIDVHSGVSTEFWNVVLVKNSYERTGYDTSGIEKFFTSPKNDFLAFTEKQSGNSLTVKILEIEKNSVANTFVFPKYKLADESRKENIEWSPVKGGLISIPVEKIPEESPAPKTSLRTVKKSEAPKSPSYAYFVSDISQNSSLNLNEFIEKEDIKEVRWDPEEENYLFFLSENNLFRANIKDKNDLTLVSENVSAFDISRNLVYFVDSSSNLVYRQELTGQKEKTQVTFSSPEENRTPFKKVILYDEDRIALIDQEEKLFIYNHGEHNDYFRKIGEGVKGVHFSDDGKKMLFWNNNEISVYFIRDWTVQPIREENEITNITRYIDPISNIQWFKDYEHVIFNVGEYIKIIELDPRDKRNCLDFPATKLKTTFVRYNNSLEKLFFTDAGDNESTNLYSIDFPENIPFLGF